MANEATATALNDLIQAAKAEARTIESQGARLKNFVKVKPLPKGKSGILFPLWDKVAAASVAEATDLTNTAVTTSGTTISPTEYGVMTVLTDVADWQTQPENVGADIGKLFGRAQIDVENQTIYGLFDGFGTSIGSSNTNITEALFRQAIRVLEGKQAPKPYYFAVTPHVKEDIMGLYATSTSLTAEFIRDHIFRTGELPPLFGVIPLLIDNLAAGTSAGQADEADTKTAIFSRDAIGFVDGFEARVEPQRDASLRGTELVSVAYWGVAELNDNYGVELLLDNKD